MSTSTSHIEAVTHEIHQPAAVARWLQTLIVILLPVVIVLSVVRLLATDQYLTIEYNRSDFPRDQYGFDYADRLNFASATVTYMRDGLGLNALANLEWRGQPVYNERELEHMVDVQKVFQAATGMWVLTLSICLIAIFILGWRRENRSALALALKRGGLLTAGLVGVAALLAVIGWQLWFDTFHRLFFAPGTWLFNATDTLIRLVPEKFWFDTALSLAGLSLAGGLLIALIGWQLQKQFSSSVRS